VKRHSPKKSADGVSRAQMVMRRGLGWMRGFPDASGDWIAFPPVEPVMAIAVGRTELRRATYSMGKLCREFPRALPKIVGDVDDWVALHQSLLEALKPKVHGSATLPRSALEVHSEYPAATVNYAQRAMSSSPALRKAISAFSWYCWLEPKRFRPATTWLEKNRDAIGVIFGNLGDADACILLVRLWELLEAHGEKNVAPLVAWFAKPLLRTTPVEYGPQYAESVHAALNWKSPKPLPARPASTLVAESRAWVEWVAQQNAKTAKRSLALFGLLHETVAMQAWEQWWQSVAGLIKQAKALPPPMRRRQANARELNAIRAKILDLGKATPPVVLGKTFFVLLQDEASNPSEVQRRAIRRGLEALPVFVGEVPTRLAFLVHWNLLRCSTEPTKQNKLSAIISGFGAFVRSLEDLEAGLQPWKSIWVDFGRRTQYRYVRYTLDSELLDDVPRIKQVYEYFSALTMLRAHSLFQDADGDDAETLVETLLATNDAERAVAMLAELKRSGLTEEYLPTSTLSLAATICGAEVEHLAPLIQSLLNVADQIDDIEDVGKALLVAWDKLPKELLRLAVLHGHLPGLCKTILKGAILRHTGRKAPRPRLRPMPAKAPAWIRRYPPQLQPALQELVVCDFDAEATATRILLRDFPDPETLRVQIGLLEERLSGTATDGKLIARIDKLQRWLANPKLPGVGRMGNLAAKLRQAAIRAIVEDWSKRVDHAYQLALPGFLDVETLPDWAAESDVLELLLPVGGLEKGMRRLVSQLLKARSGEFPWDLRDVAGNRKFLESMTKQGISIVPWLDDAPVISREVRGDTIRFTLERDPLEVFSMGGHFKTCLSPGSFNYFSVFANAADVNKQVLYGRRSDGTVVARCLLALTAEGGIVTFSAYCHDKRLSFASVLKEYVLLLAAQMHTRVLPSGKVPTLIAPDWYDDGVVDISEQFVFLSNKGFLRGLESVPLAEFASVLATALDPLGIDGQTLSKILWLDVFNRRPELVLPLYATCLHNERLAPELVLRVARLLERCEKPHEAERLSPRLFDFALATHASGYTGWFHECLAVLAWCSPTRTLSLLKKTRGKGNRSWNQETDGGRIHAAAKANLALHRRRQAERLLERGISTPCCTRHKGMCEELLAEMSLGE